MRFSLGMMVPPPVGRSLAIVGACLVSLALVSCGKLDLRGFDGGVELDSGRPAPMDAGAEPPPRPSLSPWACPERDPLGEVELARHVIVMVGDGMGPEQVAAARTFVGGALRMDELDAHNLVDTDSWSTWHVHGLPPTDSAAAATAVATGAPTVNGALGVSPEGAPLPSALDLAQDRGHATALVTTSYIYDATPMAFAVHVESRSAFEDIIGQLLARTPVDILLGGGAGLLVEDSADWRTAIVTAGYTLVHDRDELMAADPDGQVFGLFDGQRTDPPTELLWFTTPAFRRGRGESDPSLPEMTAWTLNALGDRGSPFFAVVEDEHIDELGHLAIVRPDIAGPHIRQQVAYFDEAVGAAIDWVRAHSSFDETLLVVLADHETGGYLADPDHPDGGAFSTNVHTRTPVDVFASGPGAESLHRVCRLTDVFALLTGRAASL